MHITQDNYEQFFLDHAEGNLSPEMEKELDDFLEANPDLKSVLEDFNPTPIQTVEMRNDRLKARLKKHVYPTDHIREDNVDDWMIRDLEGLLEEAQENELKEFLSLNPAYTFDYKIFGYTKLSPDLSVSYIRKNELKKNVVSLPVRRLAWILPAAAAVLLLLIGIRFFLQPEIQPVTYPVNLPITEIPMLATPGIVSGSTFPVIKEKTVEPATPSRIPSIRIKILDLKAGIVITQNEQVAMNMIQLQSSAENTFYKKEPSLIAKVFNNMITQAREGLGRRTNLDKVVKTDFNIWSIAKAGVNGYNSISDRELELYVRKDEDGKVKSYALVDQERLILSKELNKN